VSEIPNGNDQLKPALEAFGGLIEEFHRGNIFNKRLEKAALERHIGRLAKEWDKRFVNFPKTRRLFASFRGVLRRGVRDKYLKNIIVKLLEAEDQTGANKTIVNPACVAGRHARDLARRLKNYKVLGTDILPVPNWLYGKILFGGTPANYQFRQENIFEPNAERTPAAVVFFGACGSLSDAVMDYAIESNCPLLICRTCCHDNICGNTRITKRFSLLNWSFRFKNHVYSIVQEKMKGHYFSEKYSLEKYPRSLVARRLSSSNEFLKISQNSVNSDICRSIIDLDRYMYLVENNYCVWYKGELFVAQKTAE
jgi:hypothetical protein